MIGDARLPRRGKPVAFQTFVWTSPLNRRISSELHHSGNGLSKKIARQRVRDSA
jgi:hypothetical protein